MQPSGAYYPVMTRCLLLLTAALTIPGGAASGATGSGGLRGVVTRGPIMPVCMVDQPCDEPAANVGLVFVQSGTVVARARTSETGRYRISLAPGRYAVRLPGTPALGRIVKPQTVRVLRGRYSRVDFSIDTGIR
jgi:hypothetical protein